MGPASVAALPVKTGKVLVARPESTTFPNIAGPSALSEAAVGARPAMPAETTLATAETSFFENEERLRLAEAGGHIGTWEWNPSQNRQVISDELGRIFGVEPSDPELAPIWAARVWPEDWTKVQSLMQQGSQSGQMEFEYRYLHPEFGLRWLYCKGCRFENPRRMFGIVQDVTARKAAEEASQRLAALVESSDDAIVSKDLNGIVTSWNPAAERMFGFTAREMIGRSITTIIPPELRDDETRILSTIARGERIEHFDTVRMKKSGETIDVSLTVSPLKDETGRIVGAAKIARDITQRKKEERSLRMAERLAAVGRLAATVAHEINNPLEAVTNLVYLARTRSTSQEVLDFLGTAEDELARVGHLIRQTLGFYRETNGARRVRPSDLVNSVVAIFANRARNRRIDIVSEFHDDPWVNAIPGEIRQVLANLVSNSIDAISGPGRITIRVSSSRHWKGNCEPGARITVADSGSGIPPEAFRNIFEPFFTTKRDVGTGLGLWVCRSIVETHKGTIRGRTRSKPGQSWTVFSLFLPENLEEVAENEAGRPNGWLLKTA